MNENARSKTVYRAFAALADPLLSVLYPQRCDSCGGCVERQSYGSSCGECWLATRFFTGNETLCDKCGAYLSNSPARGSSFCGRCTAHVYDKARAAGIYEHALRDAVIALKTAPRVPARMKSLMIEAFERSNFASCDVILPVPLSKKRLIERGYNQAAVIGRIISSNLKIELDAALLVRDVHTPVHRAGMDRKARELTVKNAFRVVRPRGVIGQNIALIDDVFTTGATTAACSLALKKCGAAGVFVFTLGRAA